MMLNPGGSVGTMFNKSAATRFTNSQINGARMAMPLNQMAQQSLRNQYSGKAASKAGPPVGTQPNNNSPQGFEPQAPVQIPTGGPQAPEAMAQDFDPAVFAENKLDQIVGEVKTQKFLESPRVKDAMESIRFKNLMNKDNVRYQPDQRTLFEQVVSRIGMSPNE